MRVALRHLAIELPPVTIAATPCTSPGPPDSTDAALLAVFDQLQENARRYALLADSYPFQYTLELSDRTVNQRGDTGKPEMRKLRFSNGDNRPYQIGRVVEPAFGPWGDPATTLVIHSADLQDLTNVDFIKHHCFRLAGRTRCGRHAGADRLLEPASASLRPTWRAPRIWTRRRWLAYHDVAHATRPISDDRCALHDLPDAISQH